MTAFFSLKRISAIVIVSGVAACSTPDPEQNRRETAEPRVPVSAESGGHVRDDGPAAPLVRSAQTGLASWYGEPFHGRPTTSGEIFDQTAMTAAHRTLPLRSLARVTRLDTGESVLVRINDRGPFIEGRIIDLSRAAAAELGFVEEGLAQVRVEALGPADSHDRAARSRILTGN
jgi:rare lipoprotein A